MNMNLGTYVDKKGRLVLYSRADGGGNVHIEKDDVAEVILWLVSFQHGVNPTNGIQASSQAESTPEVLSDLEGLS